MDSLVIDDDAQRGDDELPTAAELGDYISRAIRDRHALVLLFVDVARHALLEHLVRVSQARESCTQHLERDDRIALNESQKTLTREHRESRIFDDGRIG